MESTHWKVEKTTNGNNVGNDEKWNTIQMFTSRSKVDGVVHPYYVITNETHLCTLTWQVPKWIIQLKKKKKERETKLNDTYSTGPFP